jgi:hypothetical protein
MGTGSQDADNLLVPTVNAIKRADGQPGNLQASRV